MADLAGTDRAPAPRRLSELPVGGAGDVLAVAGEPAMRVRLLEMGLIPGTRVSVLKRAPMGDPLELRVRGYHLSLRRAEAHAVTVAPASGQGTKAGPA